MLPRLLSLLRPLVRSSPASVQLVGSSSRRSASSLLASALPSLRSVALASRPGPSALAVGAWAESKRGMKVRSALKKKCDGCQVVMRKGRCYIRCSKDAKHKQRQGWVRPTPK